MVLSPVSFLPVPVPRLVVISHWQLGKTALFLFRVDIFPFRGVPPLAQTLHRFRCVPRMCASLRSSQMLPPSLLLTVNAISVFLSPKLDSIDRSHFDSLSDDLHLQQ